MKLTLSKNYNVPPLNRLAYVDDNSKYLNSEEIIKFVMDIISLAPPTYDKESLKAILETALFAVFL